MSPRRRAGRTHPPPMGALDVPGSSSTRNRSQRPRSLSYRMAPPTSPLMASPSRVGQRRPTACRRLGPRRLMRQPTSLPSWHTPGRTGPRPFGRRARPTPPRGRLLVSVRCEDTQHRSPGRRQTDAPHHQEDRTRVATTLARRRHHHGDRRRRSGDAPAHPARAESARPAPRSSRPDVNGPQGADPMTGTGRLTGATVRLDLDPAGCYGTSSSPGLDQPVRDKSPVS